ncbi:MAG TPA: alpha/beta hydrolase [Steroidobacteraceae bacterium]|jgi:pimeloyl-ACP methyl ester carboxylesterase|nr:alpha/beta hydrolase [Steroidobacteraceae bacterium]
MTRGPLVAAALVLLLNGACTRQAPPLPPAAPPPQPAPLAEGTPQIADSADGVHIEYQVYGHGEPAIILVHGWANNANYWNAQLEDLKARYTVVTLSLAGHGASGRNREDWSMANYAADVAAVARAIPNRKLVLVGHAMGGIVILEAARTLGSRVIGIIAVDSLKSIGQPPMTRAQFEELVQPFRADFIGHMHEFVGQYLFTRDADPAFVRKVADDMAHATPQVAIASLEALYHYDFAALPAIHVPIIAINSDLHMPTDEVRIRKSAPTFRSIVVPGAGHFLMMESPQRFNAILLQAIASLEKN